MIRASKRKVECGGCGQEAILRVLFDENDAEFDMLPPGWYAFFAEGEKPGYKTFLAYCSEACSMKVESWATDRWEKTLECAECSLEFAGNVLADPRKTGKRLPEESIGFVPPTGWYVFAASLGVPNRAAILTYCSESCVRNANGRVAGP